HLPLQRLLDGQGVGQHVVQPFFHGRPLRRQRRQRRRGDAGAVARLPPAVLGERLVGGVNQQGGGGGVLPLRPPAGGGLPAGRRVGSGGAGTSRSPSRTSTLREPSGFSEMIS